MTLSHFGKFQPIQIMPRGKQIPDELASNLIRADPFLVYCGKAELTLVFAIGWLPL